MRAATSSLVTALCVVALAGCTSSEPSAPEPSTTATVDASPSWMPPTDVSAEVVLPGTAWDAIGPDDVREESEGVVAWRVEVTCDAGTPADARRDAHRHAGLGRVESRVGVQQVAAFADADAAVAEADRLAAALTACAATAPGDSATFVVEPLAVGAQGIGLATSYYGGLEDDAMGTYLADHAAGERGHPGRRPGRRGHGRHRARRRHGERAGRVGAAVPVRLGGLLTGSAGRGVVRRRQHATGR